MRTRLNIDERSLVTAIARLRDDMDDVPPDSWYTGGSFLRDLQDLAGALEKLVASQGRVNTAQSILAVADELHAAGGSSCPQRDSLYHVLMRSTVFPDADTDLLAGEGIVRKTKAPLPRRPPIRFG